ncbi:MAG: serine/threonine protein kinase [Thermoguttaceae bacterium]|nr:serine/threonine protein kinase [Thermoguttaceae bacterium]MDW8078164.1 serine/threonine-protein kinase [Thermoguttaceae bacterium]
MVDPHSVADPGGESPLREVGQWVCVRPLSQSQFFQLFAAKAVGQPPELPPAYVVKIARDEADPTIARRLLARESDVSRAVSHPRIISVLAANLNGPCPYVVLPFLEGQTLEEILKKGPLPLWRAVGIARQIAEGLAALEKAGWRHGDLKPGNVHLGARGQVTLLDLSFAGRIGTASAGEAFLCGTPIYMAPELLHGRPKVDIRSDLYSLGLIVLEMLTGQPPSGQGLADDRPAESGYLCSPPAEWKNLPPRLDRLMGRLLAQDPLRRPAHAQEVVEQLVDTELGIFSKMSKGLATKPAKALGTVRQFPTASGESLAQAQATSSS